MEKIRNEITNLYQVIVDTTTFLKNNNGLSIIERSKYLLDIFKNIGYLTMMDFGISLPPVVLEDLKTLLVGDVSFTIPLTISEIKFLREKYLAIRTPPIPIWTEDPNGEHKWRENLEDFKDSVQKVFLDGMDITAMYCGYFYLNRIMDFPSHFQKAWNKFQEEGDKLLAEMWANVQIFFPITDNIISNWEKYPFMPIGSIKDIIHSSIEARSDKGWIDFYQKIVPAWKIKELNKDRTERFLFSSAFKSQLFIEMLSSFIDGEVFQLPGNMAKIGGHTYSLHIGDTMSMGWEVVGSLSPLIENLSSYSGAVFGSVKYYPSDAALIRFDSFLEAEKVKSLIKDKDGIICLSHKDIWDSDDHDSRDTFIKKIS